VQGTYSNYLQKWLGIKHVSSGDLVREILPKMPAQLRQHVADGIRIHHFNPILHLNS